MGTLMEARFEESMLNLEPGDLVCRARDKVREYAVVLEMRPEKSGPPQFTLSRFSSIATAVPWPKQVHLHEGWLVDEGGSILLLPDEWESTDKGAGRDVLNLFRESRTSVRQRCERIVALIADPRQNFFQNAKDVLRIMGYPDSSPDEIKILAFSFCVVAERIWRQH